MAGPADERGEHRPRLDREGDRVAARPAGTGASRLPAVRRPCGSAGGGRRARGQGLQGDGAPEHGGVGAGHRLSRGGTARPARVRRPQGRFLSEHAVLRAIEESSVAVAAPRVLALGETYQSDTIALHTYVGPRDLDRPPGHPVHGLLPHEADGLVDQLCALTHVGYQMVDPTAGECAFHPWLRDRLILLVRDLPKESQQLARHLGLPGADRLRSLLSPHRVSHREPTLLHGDLSPHNLVRRDDRLALTLIDWEMAVVGDPLYDLVRHMHLTPTRPEIRDRMFRRWERRVPAAYTRDWRRDWLVYRRLEIVRSAYLDLDRLVTGASLSVPEARRAADAYPMTLAAAMALLGLPAPSRANPYLARALA
ncbi:aminoglycoside phosphotransferase family protein [Streptomyces iakyrus]|uniref:aminoglycoside phosphotransferase family protein n=1 Tax=Streptomyces iakyrus TaxID=68219 RepID=UPI00381A63E7